MSEFNLTPSQNLFLKSSNKNTLVSASAGSGKTTTMIAKLTDLIVNKGVSVKNLLVVTYTNASGNELKQKLFNSLLKSLKNEENDEKVAFISDQLDQMINCDIGTLHSVCKKLITSYFYLLEIDPSFNILNQEEGDYLFSQSIDNVFNKLITEKDEDFYNLYELFNNKRNLNNLKNVVTVIYNYLLSKVDAEKWKKYVLQNSNNGKLCKQYILEFYKLEIEDLLKELKTLKNDAIKICDTFNEVVGDRINFLEALLSFDDLDKINNYIINHNFVQKPRTTSKMSPEQQLLSESVGLHLKDVNNVVEDIKDNYVLMSDLDYEFYISNLITLFKIVDLIKIEFNELKRNQNALDFSDLEHMTLRLLENDTIVNALREKYEYIFVDEYQDINQVQEAILTKIKRNDNMFMIGDVKQSIYQFRLSSPKIFIDKFNAYKDDNETNQVINLNENFRSNENILEFCNLIFKKLITNETIGIDYEENSKLVAGANKDFKKCVELNIIDKNEEINESKIIAKKVGDLATQGYKYGDIAILLRSKGELVNEVYNELKKYNIPCEATYKTDLFKNSEVLVIYYFLKLVNNDCDEIALATTMKSLFGGFSDDQLAQIKLFDENESFYNCCKAYLTGGDDVVIKEKLVKLNNLLEEIRFYLQGATIKDTINYLFVKYDVINYYLSFSNGSEKITNINEFVRLLSNEEYRFDLGKCIDYLDSIKKDGEITLTLNTVQDSVKIMTIHTSKGLEFPAVILGGMGKSFVINKGSEDIIINDELGVGINLLNPTARTKKRSITKIACTLANKKNELDEEIRLLYVALTRAKSYLIMVGKYDLNAVLSSSRRKIYSSSNYLDFIFKALDEESLKKISGGGNFVAYQNQKCCFDIVIHSELNNEEFTIVERPIIFNAGDKELEEKLKNNFSFKYPFDTKNVAIKNSVSQVLKEEVDYENKMFSFDNQVQENSKSLALGTAYHYVMQQLTYDNDDIKSIIENCHFDDGIVVDEEKIQKAYNKIKTLISINSKILKEAQFSYKTNYLNINPNGANQDVIVQGVIDLVIVNNNEAYIIDFKTNKTKNKKYLIDHYKLQLDLYSQAFFNAYKIKIAKKLLYSFEIGDFIEV